MAAYNFIFLVSRENSLNCLRFKISCSNYFFYFQLINLLFSFEIE